MNIGDMAFDRVTGFEGVITGEVEYMGGEHRYLISARAEGGNSPAEVWVDAARVEAGGPRGGEAGA